MDKEGEITLIASEKHHTYSRPLISYLLEGKTDLERMKYRPDSFYRDMGVDARLGVTVTALCPRERKVVCETGKRSPTTNCWWPRVPRPLCRRSRGWSGWRGNSPSSPWQTPRPWRRPSPRRAGVFILGAGLIGLKCAEGIAGRVKSVEIADLAPQILPSILDERAARRVAKSPGAAGASLPPGGHSGAL